MTNTGTGQGSTTRWVYERDVTLVADPNTNLSQSVYAVPRTRYELDHHRRVLTAIDPAGNSRSRTYSPFFDVQTSTNGVGGTTTNVFDDNEGQSLSSSTTPTGSVTGLAYESESGSLTQPYELSSTTSPRGTTTTYEYNDAGNQLSTVDALAAEAILTYNANGTVATSTTPRSTSATTEYSYNANAQLTVIDPPGTTPANTVYTYDTRGRVATVNTGNGLPTTYTYDQLDRVIRERTSNGVVDVTSTYNTAGHLATRTSTLGTTTYHYDPLGRVTRIDRPEGGTTWYGYDAASNLTSLTDPRGTTSYTYNTRNLVATMTIPGPAGSATSVFGYDDEGRRTDAWHAVGNVSNPSASYGLHQRTTFDAAGRIVRIRATSGNGAVGVVQDTSWCYAVVNATAPCPTAPAADTDLRMRETDHVTGRATVYSYDDAGRLTRAQRTDDTIWTYTYDPAGNRLTANATGPDASGSQSLAYNNANQITTSGYSYDAVGNLTAAPGRSSTYNAANQTTGVNGFPIVHDGANQAERTATGIQSSGITRYTNGLLGVEATRVGGADINDIDRDPTTGQPLAFTVLSWDGGVRHDHHYHLTDAIGSVVGLVSAAGTVTATYSYDPYGRLLNQTGNLIVAGRNQIRYAGGIASPDTDLIKFGVRYYDPTTGRFTQQDALNMPLDPGNANRYAYAANNPINYVDPTGFYWEACQEGAAAGAIGGSVSGPKGTATGAGTGCVTGSVSEFIKRNVGPGWSEAFDIASGARGAVKLARRGDELIRNARQLDLLGPA